MNPFTYQSGQLHCEGVALATVAAAVGTPCYVYSATDIRQRFRAYDAALGQHPHRVCYAVKANSNLSILRLLAAEGAGFDIVSGGELFRVLKAGGDAAKVCFAGVGKSREEMEFALASGIDTFNCESPAELDALNETALRMSRVARIALRVNPNVEASTHKHISTGKYDNKFGISMDGVEDVFRHAASLPGLRPVGVSCHIGSQLPSLDQMEQAFRAVVELALRLRSAGFAMEHVDLGGGLGIPYQSSEEFPAIAALGQRILRAVNGTDLHITVEPGRSLVGAAGALLTTVLFRKSTPTKQFLVADGAMNDLIRPVLYEAHHDVIAVKEQNNAAVVADLVGPVCESGDFFAQDRALPDAQAGELLALMTAGAYGFVQASNYNSRPRVAEVLVEGNEWRTVRRRETYEDLIRGE
jgi:diaminopimelate decarboxylase